MKKYFFMVLLFVPNIVHGADIGSVGLALQIVQNVYGLANNMADNAAGYKAQIGVRLSTEIVSDIRADSNQYLRRIAWIENAMTANPSDVDSALAVFGLSLSDTSTTLMDLKNASQTIQKAKLDSGLDIVTESDNLIAAIPKFKRLW